MHLLGPHNLFAAQVRLASKHVIVNSFTYSLVPACPAPHLLHISCFFIMLRELLWPHSGPLYHHARLYPLLHDYCSL